MDKDTQRDMLICIIKKVMNGDMDIPKDMDDFVLLDPNDFDHIAEDAADEILEKGFRVVRKGTPFKSVNKILEYFKKDYDKEINQNFLAYTTAPKGSFKWFIEAFKRWGQEYETVLVKNGITLKDIKEAYENGYIKLYNAYVKMGIGITFHEDADEWVLTYKGRRAFYKMFKEEIKEEVK